MVKVIIAGSRDFNDYLLLEKFCNKIFSDLGKSGHNVEKSNIEIISGTARGADKLGERFASEYGIIVSRHPADWDAYGKRAGYIRNEEMARYAATGELGILIAFWDGVSKGTKHMIDLAKKHGLTVYVVKY